MSKLTQFLIENPVDNVTAEVTLPGRLKDFKFKIKAMSGQQFNAYSKMATKIKGKSVEFSQAVFNEQVILNSTVEPNFKDAAFISSVGVQTPEQALYKVLLSGEIAELSKQISKLSGFDTGLDEDIEDAKNS